MTSLQRLAIEFLVAAGLLGGAWLWFHSYTKQQQQIGEDRVIKAAKDASDKQRDEDEGHLAVARRDHAAEMAHAGLGYAAALRDLESRRLRDLQAARSALPASAAAKDQSGPTGNGVTSCSVSVDEEYAILVLAHRVDELNAAARAVNEALQ